jgi:hypothetical protein
LTCLDAVTASLWWEALVVPDAFHLTPHPTQGRFLPPTGSQSWWALEDLNLWPLPCQGGERQTSELHILRLGKNSDVTGVPVSTVEFGRLLDQVLTEIVFWDFITGGPVWRRTESSYTRCCRSPGCVRVDGRGRHEPMAEVAPARRPPRRLSQSCTRARQEPRDQRVRLREVIVEQIARGHDLAIGLQHRARRVLVLAQV